MQIQATHLLIYVLVTAFRSLCFGRLHGFSNHRDLHGAFFQQIKNRVNCPWQQEFETSRNAIFFAVHTNEMPWTQYRSCSLNYRQPNHRAFQTLCRCDQIISQESKNIITNLSLSTKEVPNMNWLNTFSGLSEAPLTGLVRVQVLVHIIMQSACSLQFSSWSRSWWTPRFSAP